MIQILKGCTTIITVLAIVIFSLATVTYKFFDRLVDWRESANTAITYHYLTEQAITQEKEWTNRVTVVQEGLTDRVALAEDGATARAEIRASIMLGTDWTYIFTRLFIPVTLIWAIVIYLIIKVYTGAKNEEQVSARISLDTGSVVGYAVDTPGITSVRSSKRYRTRRDANVR